MIYGHGDDTFLIKGDLRANFSSNVYPGGMPVELQSLLKDQIKLAGSYPEPNAQPMREACARHHGLSADHFIICNGTIESIYLLAHACREADITIAEPTFSEYEDAAKLYHQNCRFIPWNALNNQKYFPSSLVMICNPNNPTGTLLSSGKIETWLRDNPHTIFIIDEAYHAFTHESQSVIHLVSRVNNLVVLRSMTKQFSIPGLRVGYLAARENLIQKLLRFKLPWSVNTLALIAGKYLLDHYEKLIPDMQPLLAETEWLKGQINAIEGFNCRKSQTTFFLVKCRKYAASELKQYLLDEHGILIRDAANFHGLDKSYFRLATQSREQNIALTNALKAWKS
jgi:threonine-phosphate decarboxylase